MGDGTLGLNPKYVKLDKQGTSISTWKRGDDVFESIVHKTTIIHHFRMNQNNQISFVQREKQDCLF